jgi:hypothetical protein
MTYCQHAAGYKLVRFVTSNGHIQLRKQCGQCGLLFGGPIPQSPYIKGEMEKFPLIDNEHDLPCQACGGRYAALHHWLPQSIARDNGLNADAWPTGYLCRKCHALWHKLVTPGLLGENWNG